MTELEAINTMLVMVGEAPISSLQVSGLADVAFAKKIYDETLREVLDRGWDFNTEEQFELELDSNSEIPIPLTALRIDPPAGSVVRGTRLYDKANHTYTYGDNATVDIVWALPFTEIPQAARWYVTVKACRRFAAARTQSDLIYQFTERDEIEALARLQEAECIVAAPNMLSDSDLPRSIYDRSF
jgi:hypothetical protein